MTATLEVEGVTAGYGRTAVLHGVGFRVAAGEAVAVLGANGAGKSTLMRVVSGHLRHRDGTVRFEGQPLTRRSPSARVRKGIVLVAEGHEVVGSLSVAENLALGAFRFWPRDSRRVVKETREQVFELFPILAERRSQLAGLLSGGEQQMLAIGRGLMARPRVLLLDEPSLGLAPLVVEQIYQRLGKLRGGDLAIVLVEQNSDLATVFCDRSYVLRLGEIVAQGTSEDLDQDQLREAYFGA